MIQYLLIGVLILFGIREFYNRRVIDALKIALERALTKLAKQELSNASERSKKTGREYHDLRDAYGRFAPNGKGKSGKGNGQDK